MPAENTFRGQPRYSRDVCSLMRRINALEARASIIPSDTGASALDFDIMDGRVYVLVSRRATPESPSPYAIKIHDATTGAPIDDFIVPVPQWREKFKGKGYEIPYEALLLPRMCCGGGYIYMPLYCRTTFARTQYDEEYGYPEKARFNWSTRFTFQFPQSPARFNPEFGVFCGPGALFRFDTTGSGQTVADSEDQSVEMYVEVQRGRQYSDRSVDWLGNDTGRVSQLEFSFDMPAARWFGSEFNFNAGRGGGSASSSDRTIYNDHAKAQIHYVDGWVYGVSPNRTGLLAGQSHDLERDDTPDNKFQRQQMCFCSGDLQTRGWSAESVVEKRGDQKFSGGLDPYSGVFFSPIYTSPTTVDAYGGFVGNTWIPDYATRYAEVEYTSIRPHVHALSVGASAVYNGRIYFDGGGEQPYSEGDSVPASYFGSVACDGSEIADFQFLHSGKLTPFVTNYGTGAFPIDRYSHAWLYATDGVYLWASEGSPSSLNRYNLASGILVDAWPELNPTQMRVIGGYLWLSYPAGFNSSGSGYQSKMECRDPVTMAVVFEFFVGDPLGQTRWKGYTGRFLNDFQDLGEPDGGVSIPVDEALSSAGVSAVVSAQFILDMRGALARLAPLFRGPSGNALNLNGTNDPENQYLLAMGDRTKYGATGGAILSWTRGEDLLEETSCVTDREYSGRFNVYTCIKDHVSSATSRPGVGGDWQNYWREGGRDGSQPTDWQENTQYGQNKTYDIDIGEIYEIVTLLEGSPTMPEPA
jgi:hypothetical protein